MSDQKQEKLRVVFEFPGALNIMRIHVDRIIGCLTNEGNYHHDWIDPGLELLILGIPGVESNTLLGGVDGRSSVVVGVNLAFDRDEVCLSVAIALGDYFGCDDVDIPYVVDNRSLRNYINS